MLREEDVGGDEDDNKRSRDYFTYQHVLFKKDTALRRIIEYNMHIQVTNVLRSLNNLCFTISWIFYEYLWRVALIDWKDKRTVRQVVTYKRWDNTEVSALEII